MEKTATQKKGKGQKDNSEKIVEAYIEYKLMNGAAPASIFQFVRSIKMKESDFYELFNSFEDLEAEIWDQMFIRTQKMIENDPVYMEYSVREKLLAFYYSFLEELKANRSFILAETGETNFDLKVPGFLDRMKNSFIHYINGLMLEGKDTSEVASRPVIENQYGKLFWIQLVFIINFWIKDKSRKFEKTDAAIEKVVNLSFDLIGKGAIDSMMDFAKFMYQNQKV